LTSLEKCSKEKHGIYNYNTKCCAYFTLKVNDKKKNCDESVSNEMAETLKADVMSFSLTAVINLTICYFFWKGNALMDFFYLFCCWDKLEHTKKKTYICRLPFTAIEVYQSPFKARHFTWQPPLKRLLGSYLMNKTTALFSSNGDTSNYLKLFTKLDNAQIMTKKL